MTRTLTWLGRLVFFGVLFLFGWWLSDQLAGDIQDGTLAGDGAVLVLAVGGLCLALLAYSVGRDHGRAAERREQERADRTGRVLRKMVQEMDRQREASRSTADEGESL